MVYLFFFASGFTALVYQVVWTRAAGLALGNTPAAVGTVVAVFMGGLALGSAWAGRAAARVRPLRLYGWIEIAVGLFALAVPRLFRAAAPVQALAYGGPLFGAVGVLTCGILLLPATALMGATLPLLAQHVGRPGGAGRLYAANSLGAALGALAAGLFLLPRVGQSAATFLAVAVNLAVGLAAVRLGGRAPTPPAESSPPEPLRRPQKVAVLVYALSGFAALVCEMAWTRALVLSLGSTVYAFALILFVFILGLAAGSALMARRAGILRDPLLAAGAIQLLIAGWGALLVWLLADLTIRIYDVVLLFAERFLWLQIAETLVVLGLLLPPTALMGALLPVTLAAFRREEGRSVGLVYAWNTVAAIAGTAAASFLLLPRLGVDLTLRLAGYVNVAAALAAFWGGPGGAVRPRAWLTGMGGAAALLLLAVPRWDLGAVSLGMYLYAPTYRRILDAGEQPISWRLPIREIDAAYWDAFGLVIVYRAGSARYLRVNGKTDASWGREDMPAQALTAHIPLLLHPNPREILVIGLGSGLTLASAQAHGAVSVDCVEISPAVIRAAAHFADVNGDACHRPGTRVLAGDGRTHVRYARGSYDVIASEPSNLWVSGMANLFTVEFFREARARLKPGGIFAQWIHIYRLSARDFRGVVRTFTEVFPRAMLWEMGPGGDYLLVGTLGEGKWRIGELEDRLRRPPVLEKLSAIDVRDAVEFLAHYAMGPGPLSELARGVPPITDDDCWVEYTAPLSMLRASLPEMTALLEGRRRNPKEILEAEGLDEVTSGRLDRFTESRRRFCRALQYSGGKNPRAFREVMDGILRSNAEDVLASRCAEREGEAAYQGAFRMQSAGDFEGALRLLSGVPTLSAAYPKALVLEGSIHARSGRPEEAVKRYREALEAQPRLVEAQVGLAQVAEAEGRIDEARALLEEAVRWESGGAAARVAHARFLWRRSEKERAREEVERALQEDPGNAAARELREKFKAE